MGQVTVFEKENCTYCRRVLQLLEVQKQAVLAELKDSCPDARLDIVTVDCGKEVAYASFCIRATGTFTVPHVFFNEEYIGSAENFLALDSTCKAGFNMLHNKLVHTAQTSKPDPPFPPPPEAAIVKVTETLAFSSQPTKPQLRALASFGIRSVLNILRPDSPAFCQEEDAIVSSSLSYVSAPMYALTADNVTKSVKTLLLMEGPVLVHDDIGTRAALVVLLATAHQLKTAQPDTKVTPLLIIGWAKDLGQDLRHFSGVIEQVLDVSA